MDREEAPLDVDQFDNDDNNENAPFMGSSGMPSESPAISSRADRLLTKAREVYEANVGLLMIAASSIFGCGMDVCVKLMSELEDPIPTIELVGIRMFFTYFVCIAVMSYIKDPHPVLGHPDVRWLLLLRGFSGFFGLLMTWKSLQYLGVADAVTLAFLLPSFTAIIAFFSLRETLTIGEIVGGAVSLCGVVLVAQPSFIFGRYVHVGAKSTPADRLLGVGIGLIGIIGWSISVTAMRVVGHRAHVLHSLAYFALCSTIASILGMVLLRIPFVAPPSGMWLVLFLTIFLFGFATQTLLAAGLQREKAGRGMLGMYIQVVFAMIADRAVFHISPSLLAYSGTALIIGSAIYIALSKTKIADPVKKPEHLADEVETAQIEAESGDEYALKEIV